MTLRKFIEFGAASRNNISLRANQNLFISKSIINKYKIANPEACFIFIDDKKPLVGLQFVEKMDKENKELRKVLKEKSGLSVNISPILRFYGIEKKKEKIEMSIIEDEELLLIDLAELKKIKKS